MRKSASAVAVLALIACGSAHAGFVGNKAEVQAPVTIAAQNTTSATWSQDSGFTGPAVSAGQKIGTLSITATGPHDSVSIAGKGSTVTRGVANLPFLDAQGTAVFRGRIQGPGINDQSNTGIDGLAGWRVASTAESLSVPVTTFGAATLPAGTFTATFYVQQYQN
ncbi:CD15/CS22/SEF14 family fimbrial major subunit [Salmonella enterica subsp. enterica serovar Manchester]|uniref:Fimbrial protein SefA n=1 Tax=Salmonella enterica subsp. enterica serovar 43:a:1,7 TaxID=2500155 RepID=A0A3Q9LY49_SALET|nr:CD15/CS22/SEF14 family fimbrial major subunit [Salmonella enterica]AZT09308.1 fimbrial protein SefA [Salmonella enterica subsp. enterica serovar 43:a:1,7]EAB5959289.1 fimbrial protein SefA [Salmonella enterica subsp. enterica serovar Manchester]EGI6152052.1 fimbrial protein SefA [Salmonella enterica subsp. enterica serovar Louga]APY79553.1 fimbrial protein SefA [Salmonella enterica subsp. enterica serovar Manchester str. ST278]AZT21713.1 fimbrial protein SefA [Salmonella enterica subsp. ent